MSIPVVAILLLAIGALALLLVGRKPKARQRNPYGDELKSKVTGFGSDVSSQRRTPFEDEILQRADQLQQAATGPLSALDLFSGYCAANAHSLANLGFTAYAVDFSPPDKSLVAVVGRKMPSGGILHYMQFDARHLDLSLTTNKLALITCQRGLHFLRYADAQKLVAYLCDHLDLGASMFFSIGAVDCAVGPGYKHSDLPVAERWHPLEPALGEPIHVTEPLCLYKAEDIQALFANLKGELVRVGRDDFGLFVVEFKKA